MGTISRVQALPLWIKAGTIISIVLVGWVTWWFVFPLFLDGKTGTEDFSHIVDGDETLVLYYGNFVNIDSTHTGDGIFRIIELSNGDRGLYFINVDIANGPALVVYLSDKMSFSSAGDSAGSYIKLGDLPANNGNFSVSIPNEVILENYKSVLIWCEPFEVVFTYASFMMTN